jgi:HD-like signal output (HDOD) protein/CheY-like chemotaxis protein
MMRVLFVDDDANTLQGLQRLLRPMRSAWDMSFMLEPKEVMTLLDREPFDVVIADMRMREMTGADLLRRIRESHPAVARIVLSGHSNTEDAVRSAGIAHQFLAKPCDPETLRATITRVVALRRLLHNEGLTRLVAGIGALPSLPSSYVSISLELDGDEPSLRRVAEIISRDIAMSAKVLQLVNSAFFGFARRVATVEQAVMLLGTDIIKSLVLSNAAFSEFRPQTSRFSLEHLWRHSLLVGAVAAAIAKSERADNATVGEALQAGLLHDLGELVLASHMADIFDAALAASTELRIPLFVAESDTLGATHAEIGAYLLGLWGLPENTVEAVAFHHEPERVAPAAFVPLTAVHAANALVHDAVCGPSCPESAVNAAVIDAAGCAAKIPAWRTITEANVNGAMQL